MVCPSRCDRQTSTGMTKTKIATRSKAATVASTVDKLRLQVFAAEPGEYIGSEDHLTQLYGVSRPTMRQAVVLLCQEGLLEARRGSRGGFFAKQPDASAITHNASIYLRIHGTGRDEIIRAAEPIQVDMTMLAAVNRDESQLNKWLELRERDASRRKSGRYQDFLIAESEFRETLGHASGNRVLKLFMNTLHSFCDWDGLTDMLLSDRPERFLTYWERRAAAVDAIIEGDSLLAGISMRRASRLLIDWTLADLRAERAAAE